MNKNAKRWLWGVALVVAGVALWEEVLEDRVVAKNFGTVVEGSLYRSGQISRHRIGPTLEKYGITTVIDMTQLDIENADQAAEARAIESLGITGFRFPMSGDGTGPIPLIADAITTLHQQQSKGEAVLVHCAAGAQRTGIVLTGYKLLVKGEDPQEVYRTMARYGWDPDEDTAWPDLLNANVRQLAELLVANGVIDSVPEPLPFFGPDPQ